MATNNTCMGATGGNGDGGEAPTCHAVGNSEIWWGGGSPANLCRNSQNFGPH